MFSYHVTKIRFNKVVYYHFTLSLQVMWRRRNDEAAGVDDLEAGVGKLHAGGSGYMVALPSGWKQRWSSAVV